MPGRKRVLAFYKIFNTEFNSPVFIKIRFLTDRNTISTEPTLPPLPLKNKKKPTWASYPNEPSPCPSSINHFGNCISIEKENLMKVARDFFPQQAGSIRKNN